MSGTEFISDEGDEVAISISIAASSQNFPEALVLLIHHYEILNLTFTIYKESFYFCGPGIS